MYTVVETLTFQRLAASIWNEGEHHEFIGWISDNALAGDVIPAAEGMRKVRWSRGGMGKRGGVRVIYFNQLVNGQIVLLLVYSKAKLDNVRPEFLIKLKEKFNE